MTIIEMEIQKITNSNGVRLFTFRNTGQRGGNLRFMSEIPCSICSAYELDEFYVKIINKLKHNGLLRGDYPYYCCSCWWKACIKNWEMRRNR